MGVADTGMRRPFHQYNAICRKEEGTSDAAAGLRRYTERNLNGSEVDHALHPSRRFCSEL
jgi:hypothetical protein